jgi:hypothetical protein
MDSQLRFVVLIASRLRSAEIPYMITGSVALAVYAQPRMTRDIDLVIECGVNDASRIAALFKPDCYVEEAEIREAIAHQSMFNIVHNEWIVKADFIVRKNDEYRRMEFSRRRDVRIAEIDVSIVSPEDLVLSKLAWSKGSESEVQRRDVRSIIAAGVLLDWTYLQRWAETLGVSDLLAEVRS